MFRSNFEVQTKRGDRWVIHGTFDREAEAKTNAEALAKNPKIEGVRVVRDWERSDGNHVEKVLFEHLNPVNDKTDVSVSPIETAPLCETDDDLRGSQSRATINRLFRKYLEEEILTPTELMHNYQQLRRLMYQDNLLPSAVDRVATLHAAATGEEYQDQATQLHQAIDRLARRAKEVEEVELPRFEDATIGQVRREIDQLGFFEDTDFLTVVALSRELSQWRNWVAKLDFVLRARGDDDDEHARDHVDGIIADTFGSPVALKEVLGSSRSLFQAMMRQLDLVDGVAEPINGSADDVLELLNPLFANDVLSTAKNAVLDYVVREVRSPNKLDPHAEQPFDLFDELCARLITPHGVMHGEPMVEALVERCSRLMNLGGESGRKKAVAELIRRQTPAWRKIPLICALLESPLHGVEDVETVTSAVHDELLTLPSLRAFVDPRDGAREKMVITRQMHELLRASKLPVRDQETLCEFLDDMLAKYLIKEQVIERIDNPKLPLRKRAYMLVKFCASGVLIEGKSAEVARKRVVGYLKQPGFTDKLVEDIKDPKAKELALRDFYIVLQKSGF